MAGDAVHEAPAERGDDEAAIDRVAHQPVDTGLDQLRLRLGGRGAA